MSDHSAIEWTDASWNPIRARNTFTGKIGWHCTHASEGCRFCYAEGFNRRLGTGEAYVPGALVERDGLVEVFLDEKMLLVPMRWKKPRMIFPGSMTDLFADFVTDEMLLRVFGVMAHARQHTFQVLTKRAQRMHDFCDQWARQADSIDPLNGGYELCDWPLPNVWLGVSAERQEEADERIPLLLQTPAAVRFVSAEPLLGAIDLTKIQAPANGNPARSFTTWNALRGYSTTNHPVFGGGGVAPGELDWVITGGESGPHARPMNPQWARDIRDQCDAAGVAFFFKQWGEYLPVGQSLPGCGKVHGATAVKPGRMKLHYGGTPQQAPKHAFAERGVGFASAADGRLTFRVGKKAAGRLLDGVEHSAFPQAAP